MRLDVKIPAYGDRQHLQTEIGKSGTRKQKAEIPGAKGCVGVQLNSIAYGIA
jgi:hypothetical protein